MPTPIDTVSVVFHEWGPYPTKLQAEWDMPQPPQVKYIREGINVVGICVYFLFEAFNEETQLFLSPLNTATLYSMGALNTASQC